MLCIIIISGETSRLTNYQTKFHYSSEWQKFFAQQPLSEIYFNLQSSSSPAVVVLSTSYLGGFLGVICMMVSVFAPAFPFVEVESECERDPT